VFGVITGPTIIVDHNTFISSHEGINLIARGAGIADRQTLVITNNVMHFHTNPLTGAKVTAASATATYTNNLIVGGNCSHYPAGNRCPRNWAAVGFVRYANGNGGDYTLGPDSPYKGTGTDQFGVGTTDPGANVARVTAATACTESGQCG
jgi:hypothetical protein